MSRYQDALIEDRNYYNDHRTRAGEAGSLWKGFDEKKMVLTIVVHDHDEDETQDVEFPAQLEVCATCQGKGKYVNPSIDASGISRDQFDDDPDFEESYHSGAYDVTCASCEGNRVVPAVDIDRLTGDIEEQWNNHCENLAHDADFEAMARAERSMGC